MGIRSSSSLLRQSDRASSRKGRSTASAAQMPVYKRKEPRRPPDPLLQTHEPNAQVYISFQWAQEMAAALHQPPEMVNKTGRMKRGAEGME